MRFNINLASQPYEDARRFYMQWIPLLAALAVIALMLTGRAYQNFQASRDLATQITEKQNQIRQLEQEQVAAQAMLGRPENSGTRDRAQFLNELFARKAFSWTQVMTDLEKIMPPHVQVVSIHPELSDGQLQFSMSVTSNERESAIDLIRRMESSPRFEQAQLRAENSTENPGQDKIRVEIVALYLPNIGKSSAAKAER